jgi:hypothetical protein
VYTADGRRYFLQLKQDDRPDKKNLTKGDWWNYCKNVVFFWPWISLYSL